ncbi:MAG TPA: ATP-binding protein [Candidatus Sulfotelmatobacter sp.]|nr:ATP-binding protein [Candidatus Sulfotelmatobacter sp.]
MKSETADSIRSAELLEEAEQTLRAIRYGAVDAFVVEEPEGHRVYTLEGSDLPYSTLVERMQQGAAMLDERGCVVYCNHSLALLLGVARESMIGRYLRDFVRPEDLASYEKLLHDAQSGSSEGEMLLRLPDSRLVFANFSFCLLSRDKSATGVLISDLTAQKQQAEFASRLQKVQDDERKRIARELHDSVGQLLTAIGMNINVVQSQSAKLDSDGARAVADNTMLVRQVSNEIRTLSHLLHPPLLDLAGVVSALRWYVDGFAERSKIKVDLDLPDDLGRLSPDIEITVFRIVQECLTNIHRHSGSATAAISLHEKDNVLVLQVRDSGKGISPEKQQELTLGRGGVGVEGMRERLKQLGGSFEIKSAGTGTVVTATLPLAQAR